MNADNQLLTKVESARLWNYFHKDWLLQIRLALREQLPPEYRVFVESEAVILSTDPGETTRVVLPDAAITRGATPSAEPTRAASGATAAVVEAEEPCEIETHYSLIIRRAPENRIVAAVELLSPSNKGLGSRLDEQKHLCKRDEYLEAGVSLLEIDALTEGRRTLPAALMQLDAYDRIAWTAAQAHGRRSYRGWGWNDDDPLPVIDWQLDEDHQVLLDTGRTLKEAAGFNDWETLLSVQ